MIVTSAGKNRSPGGTRPMKSEIVFDPNLNESDHYEGCQTNHTPTTPAPQPSGLTRATMWSDDVEEYYRFQMAGYRDLREYCHVQGVSGGEVCRWPHNGYIKMLRSRKGAFIYFNRDRECADKDLHKCKIFNYNDSSNGQ